MRASVGSSGGLRPPSLRRRRRAHLKRRWVILYEPMKSAKQRIISGSWYVLDMWQPDKYAFQPHTGRWQLLRSWCPLQLLTCRALEFPSFAPHLSAHPLSFPHILFQEPPLYREVLFQTWTQSGRKGGAAGGQIGGDIHPRRPEHAAQNRSRPGRTLTAFTSGGAMGDSF